MRTRFGRSLVALALAAPLIAVVAPSTPVAAADPVCELGNGIQHVVEITFDNVHFFRDNPNMPSDLELMPHLNDFIQDNGVMLSNNHTPLIAHTAEDSLAIYTGLYGDRHGMPISNTYRTWKPNGTVASAGSFVYWTDPNNDGGNDPKHAMIYSDSVPASATTTDVATPAPWVPWTRAGCDVGDVSTANMVLENAPFDIPKVFGPGSPEAAAVAADPNQTFFNQSTADYLGLAVHCARGSAFCADAQAVKFGQVSPSHTAVTDSLPNEPGGYTGYQALFGHKYIAPQLGAGTANVIHGIYPVTNGDGNLVDLSGNQINGFFVPAQNTPGFPGFGPIVARQTLAYTADMLEAGVPVVYGYIGDIHERKAGQSGCTTTTATAAGNAIGPGDTCYKQTADQYDQAFQTFFARLAASGINQSNTLFVFSAEENDQFDGANVGRAIQPAPAGCGIVNNVFTPCNYTAGQIGEINTNLPGLLAAQKGNTTPFTVEPQGAAIYVTGRPGPTDPAVRQLERDIGSLTNPHDPYTGNDDEPIAAYLAGSVEQEILHLINADPDRTPTFTLFPKPDYFFGSTAACTPQDQAPCASNGGTASRFAWNHGYYAPTIDITWVGFVGPGVEKTGLDGPEATDGPAIHDPNGGGTVPEFSTVGTWADLPDIRPTLLWLAGLKDSYVNDGRVLSEILTDPNIAIAGSKYTDLAECYKQLNASVGEFGTNTLIADTAALKSGGGGDGVFTSTQKKLSKLLSQRDPLATELKNALFAAAFDDVALPGSGSQLGRCGSMLDRAEELVTGG